MPHASLPPPLPLPGFLRFPSPYDSSPSISPLLPSRLPLSPLNDSLSPLFSHSSLSLHFSLLLHSLSFVTPLTFPLFPLSSLSSFTLSSLPSLFPLPLAFLSQFLSLSSLTLSSPLSDFLLLNFLPPSRFFLPALTHPFSLTSLLSLSPHAQRLRSLEWY